MPLPRPLARQGPAFPAFGTWNLDGRRPRPGVAQGVRAQGAARQSAVVLQRRADRRPARLSRPPRRPWLVPDQLGHVAGGRGHEIPESLAGAVQRARPGGKACPFAAERTCGPDSKGLLASLGSYGVKDTTGQ